MGSDALASRELLEDACADAPAPFKILDPVASVDAPESLDVPGELDRSAGPDWPDSIAGGWEFFCPAAVFAAAA